MSGKSIVILALHGAWSTTGACGVEPVSNLLRGAMPHPHLLHGVQSSNSGLEKPHSTTMDIDEAQSDADKPDSSADKSNHLPMESENSAAESTSVLEKEKTDKGCCEDKDTDKGPECCTNKDTDSGKCCIGEKSKRDPDGSVDQFASIAALVTPALVTAEYDQSQYASSAASVTTSLVTAEYDQAQFALVTAAKALQDAEKALHQAFQNDSGPAWCLYSLPVFLFAMAYCLCTRVWFARKIDAWEIGTWHYFGCNSYKLQLQNDCVARYCLQRCEEKRLGWIEASDTWYYSCNFCGCCPAVCGGLEKLTMFLRCHYIPCCCLSTCLEMLRGSADTVKKDPFSSDCQPVFNRSVRLAFGLGLGVMGFIRLIVPYAHLFFKKRGISDKESFAEHFGADVEDLIDSEKFGTHYLYHERASGFFYLEESVLQYSQPYEYDVGKAVADLSMQYVGGIWGFSFFAKHSLATVKAYLMGLEMLWIFQFVEGFVYKVFESNRTERIGRQRAFDEAREDFRRKYRVFVQNYVNKYSDQERDREKDAGDIFNSFTSDLEKLKKQQSASSTGFPQEENATANATSGNGKTRVTSVLGDFYSAPYLLSPAYISMCLTSMVPLVLEAFERTYRYWFERTTVVDRNQANTGIKKQLAFKIAEAYVTNNMGAFGIQSPGGQEKAANGTSGQDRKASDALQKDFNNLDEWYKKKSAVVGCLNRGDLRSSVAGLFLSIVWEVFRPQMSLEAAYDLNNQNEYLDVSVERSAAGLQAQIDQTPIYGQILHDTKAHVLEGILTVFVCFFFIGVDIHNNVMHAFSQLFSGPDEKSVHGPPSLAQHLNDALLLNAPKKDAKDISVPVQSGEQLSEQVRAQIQETAREIVDKRYSAWNISLRGEGYAETDLMKEAAALSRKSFLQEQSRGEENIVMRNEKIAKRMAIGETHGVIRNERVAMAEVVIDAKESNVAEPAGGADGTSASNTSTPFTISSSAAEHKYDTTTSLVQVSPASSSAATLSLSAVAEIADNPPSAKGCFQRISEGLRTDYLLMGYFSGRWLFRVLDFNNWLHVHAVDEYWFLFLQWIRKRAFETPWQMLAVDAVGLLISLSLWTGVAGSLFDKIVGNKCCCDGPCGIGKCLADSCNAGNGVFTLGAVFGVVGFIVFGMDTVYNVKRRIDKNADKKAPHAPSGFWGSAGVLLGGLVGCNVWGAQIANLGVQWKVKAVNAMEEKARVGIKNPLGGKPGEEIAVSSPGLKMSTTNYDPVHVILREKDESVVQDLQDLLEVGGKMIPPKIVDELKKGQDADRFAEKLDDLYQDAPQNWVRDSDVAWSKSWIIRNSNEQLYREKAVALGSNPNETKLVEEKNAAQDPVAHKEKESADKITATAGMLVESGLAPAKKAELDAVKYGLNCLYVAIAVYGWFPFAPGSIVKVSDSPKKANDPPRSKTGEAGKGRTSNEGKDARSFLQSIASSFLEAISPSSLHLLVQHSSLAHAGQDKKAQDKEDLSHLVQDDKEASSRYDDDIVHDIVHV